ncbi:Cytoplasmic protein, partial [Monkeypox virus]
PSYEEIAKYGHSF